MKSKIEREKGFTIVELLVVLSIIMLLLGMLLPAFNKVREYSKRLNQTAQFHAIVTGLEMFHNDFDVFPESGRYDMDGAEYPGAMKLAEAMLGQDLLGLHKNSVLKCNDDDEQYFDIDQPPDEESPEYINSLRARMGPYITRETAGAHRLEQLFFGTSAFPCDGPKYLLCDAYARTTNLSPEEGGDKKVGMPILYYTANVSNNLHDYTKYQLSRYNYQDNHELTKLGPPWNPAAIHPLFQDQDPDSPFPGQGEMFYAVTKDEDVITTPWPVMEDSYILMSAGFDGLDGTKDDVYNFGD